MNILIKLMFCVWPFLEASLVRHNINIRDDWFQVYHLVIISTVPKLYNHYQIFEYFHRTTQDSNGFGVLPSPPPPL